jgi:hypothetical protein
MKKQILTFVAAAAIALSGAGAALAACNISPLSNDSTCVDFNMWGASAENNFFNAVADQWLKAPQANGGLGCATATAPALYKDSKQGVSIGTHCLGGATTVVFRYGNKASWDGIIAVTGGNYNAYTTEAADACVASTGKNYRTIINEASALGACTGNPGLGNVCYQSANCQPVNVGAADVAANELVQQSTGSKLGPLGGAYITRNFAATNGVATSGSNVTWPVSNSTVGDKVLVVPFSFWVNNSVTASTCSGGSSDGSPCAVAGDCPSGSCVSGQIENITHEQAVSIFSGTVDNWADFGVGYVAQPMDVCFRHAGSGSHATLDWTVMHGGTSSLQSIAHLQGATGGPGNNTAGNLWFNDGTTDALNCANRSSSIGSITYTDSDAVSVSQTLFGLTFPNLHEVKYQGLYGRHHALTGGQYDFYTTQHLYITSNSAPTGSTQLAIYNDLLLYLQDTTHLPASEAGFWALPTEMGFDKDNMRVYPGDTGNVPD